MSRRRRAIAAVLALVLLAAAALTATGAFRSHNSAGTQGAPPPATQPVVRENLSSQCR